MKLLYRDYIPVKHAERKRLASEIQDLESQAARQGPQQQLALRADAGRDADNTASLMSTLMVKYLMEVSWYVWLHCEVVMYCVCDCDR